MQKLINFLKDNKWFVVVLILASFLRFYRLADTPHSLNWDEISHGYNAYSVLKTGKDEWGATLPAIFRAYGDYKLPVYIYLTAISEAIFGLTPFAVRFVSALAGIGTVVFTYFLVLELFKNHKSLNTDHRSLATIASLLVALEPWSLFLSRGAFEANLALLFIVSSVYLFIRGVQNTKYLIPSSILLGLSLWTYNSARIFGPLFVVALILIHKKRLTTTFQKEVPTLRTSAFIFGLFLLPMLFQLFNPAGLARYSKVSIIDEGAVSQINEARGKSKSSPLVRRLIYNKGTYFAKSFVKNYFSYFSPEFLFLEGGSQYQFSVPGRGLIYLINLPFFVIGLLWLLKKRDKTSTLLLAWLFLAAIPGSLTREAPHVLRAIVMLPVPMIISAVGLSVFLNWLDENRRQSALLLYSLAILAFTGNYLQNYFENYRKDYSWSWQYGYKEAVDYVRESYDNYAKIVVTKKYGEPHEFFLFWYPWNPVKYRDDAKLNRFYQSGWYWVDGFDKFYFVNDWEIPKQGFKFVQESKGLVDCKGAKCVLITSPGNAPSGWSLVKTINFLDGKPAFEIYVNN